MKITKELGVKITWESKQRLQGNRSEDYKEIGEDYKGIGEDYKEIEVKITRESK